MNNWLVKTITIVPEHGTTFETPAKGDGFSFEVTIHCVPKAVPKRRFRSEPVIDREAVLGQIRAQVRERCRQHSPFTPEEAEREINARLRPSIPQGWHVRVEVGATEQVRVLQQKAQAEQHAVAALAEVVRSRVTELGNLREHVESFLKVAAESWESRYAIALSQQPDHAAAIVNKMYDERKKEAEQLMNSVQKMVEAHKTADIYDLVIASDGALRQALASLGVAVPPIDSDPLFVPADLRGQPGAPASMRLNIE
ncbi:hypothetical protein OIE66_09415 [Nonomuraea sp. NBC_01738]|uniref:hypothetical protein n=1 Tax=Nonomuraea sp. NBC_01738 TaxID=2976003 RepID=UPI002E10222B|nr:hypothetical protein OIE66_09415 [Nonomuraea sp. NBC_01738]